MWYDVGARRTSDVRWKISCRESKLETNENADFAGLDRAYDR